MATLRAWTIVSSSNNRRNSRGYHRCSFLVTGHRPLHRNEYAYLYVKSTHDDIVHDIVHSMVVDIVPPMSTSPRCSHCALTHALRAFALSLSLLVIRRIDTSPLRAPLLVTLAPALDLTFA